ncbi:amidase signature enzyme [Thozetella sp. PMI_491]|nr:amidase signature enzyme [Thozetella sp. PMI_491]
MDWKSTAKEKRDSLISRIPDRWRITALPPSPPSNLPDVTGEYIRQYLTPREVEITESDAVDTVQETTTGQWKAKEVTLAFCHRAALAHQMVFCLHEIFFDQAIEDAEQLDANFERYCKPVGLLRGLPVSLKDTIHVKGVETTMATLVGSAAPLKVFQAAVGDEVAKVNGIIEKLGLTTWKGSPRANTMDYILVTPAQLKSTQELKIYITAPAPPLRLTISSSSPWLRTVATVKAVYSDTGCSIDYVNNIIGSNYTFTFKQRDTGNYSLRLPANQIGPSSK